MALSPGFSFDPSAKLPRCTPLSVLPLLRMLPFSTCPESAHSLFQQHDPAGTTFFSSMARFPFLSMSFPRFYIDSQEGDHRLPLAWQSNGMGLLGPGVHFTTLAREK